MKTNRRLKLTVILLSTLMLSFFLVNSALAQQRISKIDVYYLKPGILSTITASLKRTKKIGSHIRIKGDQVDQANEIIAAVKELKQYEGKPITFYYHHRIVCIISYGFLNKDIISYDTESTVFYKNQYYANQTALTLSIFSLLPDCIGELYIKYDRSVSE